MNGRIPLIDLAGKLSCSSQRIKYKIDNLKKKGVIMAFKVSVDLSKLNLRHYKIDIILKEHKHRKMIIDYISKQIYLHELNEAIGWADIEPEVFVKDIDKLIEIMEDLDSRFPGAIKKQSYWVDIKEHKLNTLPEMEFK